MVFSSLLFLFIYLPLTLLVYYVAPRAWRNFILFFVSLIFYGWGEPVYIALMLFSITINYAAGFLVEKYRDRDRLARRVVFGSVALNLLLLIFFKYYDFLAASFTQLTGLALPVLGLGLPIGISFYTFQAMSYPIDVYRSDAEVQRSYVRFGAFVTLFPQLIAGPIIRYKDVADQLNISKSITEFWRRWHISLSTWFRDYVYIPLGGNRVSRLKNYRNIFIVWMLTGLWHGASWNFVLWGVYFAVLLMLEKAFLLNWLKKAPAVLAHLYTLLLVMLSWAIFAIEDFGALGAYLGAVFGGAPLTNGAFWYNLRSYLPLLVILCLASTPLSAKLYGRIPERVRAVLSPVLVLAGLIVSTAYLVDSTYNPFLYFRF